MNTTNPIKTADKLTCSGELAGSTLMCTEELGRLFFLNDLIVLLAEGTMKEEGYLWQMEDVCHIANRRSDVSYVVDVTFD